jgi:hypothetical protein
VAQDIAIEVRGAELPLDLLEHLANSLYEPSAGIGDDQPNSFQAAIPQME